MKFAIHLAATENRLGVTHAQLVAIAAACTTQLNRDVGPHWAPGEGHEVTVATSPTGLPASDYVMSFVDELPDAPGAIAYHDVNGAGVPVLYLALSLCATVLSGSDSVSVAASHEFIETIGDPVCNLWADGGDGREYCRELCDAVESAFYNVTVTDSEGHTQSVAVSDFVLPQFFNVQNKGGAYSFLHTAKSPFETTHGGYQIVRAADGQPSQVTNDRQRLMAKKRTHWSSRANRRMTQQLHAYKSHGGHGSHEAPSAGEA